MNDRGGILRKYIVIFTCHPNRSQSASRCIDVIKRLHGADNVIVLDGTQQHGLASELNLVMANAAAALILVQPDWPFVETEGGWSFAAIGCEHLISGLEQGRRADEISARYGDVPRLIIPLLVDHATLPYSFELPVNISGLMQRQAVVIRDGRFILRDLLRVYRQIQVQLDERSFSFGFIAGIFGSILWASLIGVTLGASSGGCAIIPIALPFALVFGFAGRELWRVGERIRVAIIAFCAITMVAGVAQAINEGPAFLQSPNPIVLAICVLSALGMVVAPVQYYMHLNPSHALLQRRGQQEVQVIPPGAIGNTYFLSYRRVDTHGLCDAMYAFLVKRAGRRNVFRDIQSILPGTKFAEIVDRALDGTDLVFALIGNHWQTVTDENGIPRIYKPDDFVRLELAGALSRGKPIVPVLADNAVMPRQDELPPDLAQLAQMKPVVVRTGSRRDLRRLFRAAVKVQNVAKYPVVLSIYYISSAVLFLGFVYLFVQIKAVVEYVGKQVTGSECPAALCNQPISPLAGSGFLVIVMLCVSLLLVAWLAMIILSIRDRLWSRVIWLGIWLVIFVCPLIWIGTAIISGGIPSLWSILITLIVDMVAQLPVGIYAAGHQFRSGEYANPRTQR